MLKGMDCKIVQIIAGSWHAHAQVICHTSLLARDINPLFDKIVVD